MAGDEEEDGICPHFILRSQCMECKKEAARRKIANMQTPHMVGEALIEEAKKRTPKLLEEKAKANHVLHPEDWTVEEVLERLGNRGYSNHVQAFRDFEPAIDGAKLLKLHKEDYRILAVDSRTEYYIRADLARLQLLAELPDGIRSIGGVQDLKAELLLFENCPRDLKSLDVSGIDFSDLHLLGTLLEAFRFNQFCAELIMRGCRITDDGAKIVAKLVTSEGQGLEKPPDEEEGDIRIDTDKMGRPTKKGRQQLAEQKKRLAEQKKRRLLEEAKEKDPNYCLVHLDLSNNVICESTDKEVGLRVLVEALKKTTISKVDLSRNNIKAKGAVFIGEWLENNEVLTDLNLSNNCLTSEDVKYLLDQSATTRREEGHNLKYFDVSKNYIFSRQDQSEISLEAQAQEIELKMEVDMIA